MLKDRQVPDKRAAVTKAMLRGLKAGVYYAIGQIAIAAESADEATSLAKQLGMSGQYTSFCAAAGIEWAAEVHLHLSNLPMLREDCGILDSIAAKFPIMLDVARRYAQALETLTKNPLLLSAGLPALPGPAVVDPQLQNDLQVLDEFLHSDAKPSEPMLFSVPPVEELNLDSFLNTNPTMP